MQMLYNRQRVGLILIAPRLALINWVSHMAGREGVFGRKGGVDGEKGRGWMGRCKCRGRERADGGGRERAGAEDDGEEVFGK